MTADLRLQFPVFQTGDPASLPVFLDNAATTHKPRAVVDSIRRWYCETNANVHRGAHTQGALATWLFEQARDRVRQFINARFPDEILWTSGATAALNLLAFSWGDSQLRPGDEIVLSAMEHHANIVPWQQTAVRTGARIRVIPVTAGGQLDEGALERLLTRRTRLLAITHVSNALGTVNPVADLIARARERGITTVIDGSQAVAHRPVDVQQLGCDFYVFSGHKMYGPTGTGVLYGRRELLQAMPPWQTGGEMVEHVSFSGSRFQPPPLRFEAGTPNVAGVMGLAAAVEFLTGQDRVALRAHEDSLRERLESALDAIPAIRRTGRAMDRSAIVSFVVEGTHHQDMALLLDQQGIAVRAGHHCAMPLMEALGLKGTVRASLACYNTHQDVDRLVAALHQVLDSRCPSVAVPATAGPALAPVRSAEAAIPSGFGDFPVFSEEGRERLAARLAGAPCWQERYRRIMQLAQELPRLPEAMRTEAARLAGCSSRFWLHHHHCTTRHRLYFALDSDARIMRGLAGAVLYCLNGRSPEAVLACDMGSFFADMELERHLNPSRENGLHQLILAMQERARACLRPEEEPAAAAPVRSGEVS